MQHRHSLRQSTKQEKVTEEEEEGVKEEEEEEESGDKEENTKTFDSFLFVGTRAQAGTSQLGVRSYVGLMS